MAPMRVTDESGLNQFIIPAVTALEGRGGEGGESAEIVQHKYHISSSDLTDLLTIKNQVRYPCQKLLSSGIVLGLDH